MDFIAVLDYEHLDNGMFLKSFARALSKKKQRGIIIHGASEYTERIIQTGVMREEAELRAIKELNHRLIALFADEGVSTIGLNGFQKSLITTDGKEIFVDKTQLHDLPKQPMLLLSNLGLNTSTGNKQTIPLPKLAYTLKNELNIQEIVVFSKNESSDIIDEQLDDLIRANEIETGLKEKHLPESFRNTTFTVRLTTANKFMNR